jgi:tetratricopeptide (TPR) repeat protein
MKARELFWAHRYTEASAEYRRDLAKNPNDMAAVGGMANVLRAGGEYAESLLYFERLAAQRREDKIANMVAPGSFPWQIDIACLHWLLGNRSKAIQMMHGSVAGIIDGTIKYGDAAGGMTQGLLLYYMGISAKEPEEISFALSYMQNRLNQNVGQNWPRAVAQYYLGNTTFENVMESVNRRPNIAVPLEVAKVDLLRRRRLSVALFHVGIRSRAQGDEERCLVRMQECFALENPLIEQEWYLARYEVNKGTRP